MADDGVAPRDRYADITGQIVAALEAGTPPWRRPWDPAKAGTGGPHNGVSGHRYRGINTLLLGMSPLAMAGADPRWLSFRQAQEKGWRVRKGERASTVFFFKRVELKGDGGSSENLEGAKIVPVLRSYPVFHGSQIEGIPAYVPPTSDAVPWRTPEAAAVIVTRSGAAIRAGGDKAYYSPAADSIQMPPRGAFRTAVGWAATMMHELGHWTGHPSRLNRDLQGRFGTAAYAMEELRAELASAFVGGELGLPTELEQHASYIDGWLEVLRKDKRELFRAAADAQRIADYVLAFHPLYAARMSEGTDAKKEPAHPTATARPFVPAAGLMPEHVRRTLTGTHGLDAPAIAGAAAEEAACAPAFRR